MHAVPSIFLLLFLLLAHSSPPQDKSTILSLSIPHGLRWAQRDAVAQRARQSQSFTQCHQDTIIAHLLGNSHFLNRYTGWQGICVSRLSQRCQLIGAVSISMHETSLFEFNMRNDHKFFIGPFSDGFDKNRSTLEYFESRQNLVRVSTKSLEQILKIVRAPPVIDYLSLDVEGAEIMRMEDVLLHRYQFNVLVLELPSEKLIQKLTENGYRFITRFASFHDELWLNELFIDETLHSIVPNVSDFFTYEEWIACNNFIREVSESSHPSISIFFILFASIFILLIIFNRKRMNKLDDLNLAKYNTDKVPNGLIPFYDEYFSEHSHQKVAMLALGVDKGGDVALWADYFPLGIIVGIDIKLPNKEDFPIAWENSRIKLIEGSQDDEAVLRRAAAAATSSAAGRANTLDGKDHETFDFIIDDASHVAAPTKKAFWYLFDNYLRPGGWYFIEDWGTGYWERWPDGEAYMEGRNHQAGMLGFVKSLIDELGSHDRSRQWYDEDWERDSKFAKVLFFPTVVAIQKVTMPLKEKIQLKKQKELQKEN